MEFKRQKLSSPKRPVFRPPSTPNRPSRPLFVERRGSDGHEKAIGMPSPPDRDNDSDSSMSDDSIEVVSVTHMPSDKSPKNSINKEAINSFDSEVIYSTRMDSSDRMSSGTENILACLKTNRTDSTGTDILITSKNEADGLGTGTSDMEFVGTNRVADRSLNATDGAAHAMLSVGADEMSERGHSITDGRIDSMDRSRMDSINSNTFDTIDTNRTYTNGMSNMMDINTWNSMDSNQIHSSQMDSYHIDRTDTEIMDTEIMDTVDSSMGPIRLDAGNMDRSMNSIEHSRTCTTVEHSPSLSQSSRHGTSNVSSLTAYLSRTNGSAYTLFDLLAVHNYRQPSDNLSEVLHRYVVTPRGSIQSPNSMPLQHIVLANDNELDGEAFLMRLWSFKSSRAEASEFNAEIHRGPWLELLGIADRGFCTFVLLHCDVFRPAGNGLWLCLTRNFDLGPYYTATYHNQQQNQDLEWLVDKQDIMYRHTCHDIPSLPSLPVPEALNQLIAISHRRLAMHTQLVKSRKVSGPRFEQCKPVPVRQLARYVANRVRGILPRSMMGSQHNQQQLNDQLQQFLPVRSRVNLRHMLKGIKLSEIPWLRQCNDGVRDACTDFLYCLYYIYNFVVKHILRLHFYVTEMSGNSNCTLHYYPQSMWNDKMERPAASKFLETHNESSHFQDIGVGKDKAEQEKVTNPVNWRLVPKPDGSLRPIINLKNANKALQVPHLVLNHHILNRGNRVRLDSWQRWITKITEFRERFAEGTQFFCVKADITSCYDNANRSKVIQIVNSVLEDGIHSYIINGMAHVDVRKKNMRVRKIVRQSNEPMHAHTSVLPGSRINLAFERPPYTIYTGHEILDGVNTLFNDIHLRTGRDSSVKFTSGIPQGSACSLDLCNLLLDDMVDIRLSRYVDDPHSLLLRYVDDFLFVSTDDQLASEFADDMARGFDEYGVHCNANKIMDGTKSPEISFLGTLIDPTTLKLRPTRIEAVDFAVASRGDNKAVKRRLDVDMDRVVGILRAFRRQFQDPPIYLENQVAANMGHALVYRLPSFMKVYREETPQVTFYRVLEQYLLPVVANKSRRRVKQIAKRSYFAVYKHAIL